ncbi:unnamed protein product [Schistosoma turkestanicum]|nr:unnamed protein product [Schistosoma turkestanicum]
MIIISVVLINGHWMTTHKYDEPLIDSNNLYYMMELPRGLLWYKRIHEPTRLKKKDRILMSVKRPQKSANYYYDLYRQSMLPANEFLG